MIDTALDWMVKHAYALAIGWAAFLSLIFGFAIWTA